MSWIVHPLTIYSVLASSLVVFLYLFVSLKGEITKINKARAEDALRWALERNRHQSSLENLRAAVDEAAQTTEPQVSPAAAPAVMAAVTSTSGMTPMSLNLTKRSQALRRWRRGESPDQISAALEMPRAEVEILIKAFRAASSAATGASVGR